MSNLKGIPKKYTFVNNINYLCAKIKALYNYLNENINKENVLINLLEKKLINANPVISEKINYLKLYIDGDKDSISEFYNEARNIFKNLKIIYNSLKYKLNDDNSQYTPNKLNSYQFNETNINNNNLYKNFGSIKNEFDFENTIKENNKEPKSRTPIKYLAQNNNLKILQVEISNKNKEIKYLKSQLKILEDEKNQYYEDFNELTNQNAEYEKENKELRKKYQDLQIKYNQLEQNCYDFKSEDRKNSELEEEFNLKMIAKGAKEKNYSQDMNIDNPGLQALKDKFRSIFYKYNTLTILVRNLLTTIKIDINNNNIVKDIYKVIF